MIRPAACLKGVDKFREGLIFSATGKQAAITTNRLEVATALSVANFDGEQLRQACIIYEDLIHLVLEGAGVDAITERLHGFLGNPVAVADRFGHFVASSPKTAHGDPHRRDTISRGGFRPELLEDTLVGPYFLRVRQDKCPVVFPAFPALGFEQRRLMAPILAAEDFLGYVTVLETEQILQEVHVAVIQQGAMMLALEMLKHRVAFETELRHRGEVLADLFLGTYETSDIVRRAGLLGIDLLRPWILMVIDLDEPSTELTAPVRTFDRYRLVEAVGRRIDKYLTGGMLVIQRQAIVVMVPAADENLALSKAVELATSFKAKVQGTLKPGSISVAVAGICSQLKDYRRLYLDAERALAVTRNLGWRDRVVTLEDLDIYGLLLNREDPEHLRRFSQRMLHPLEEYDSTRGTHLVETLDAYLSHNCGFRSTARSLGIHLNTLRGRLDRITKLSGVELNDARARLSLQIALEVRRLNNSAPI